MDTSTVVWIIVIVVVLLIAAGVAAMVMRRGDAERRERPVPSAPRPASAPSPSTRSRRGLPRRRPRREPPSCGGRQASRGRPPPGLRAGAPAQRLDGPRRGRQSALESR